MFPENPNYQNNQFVLVPDKVKLKSQLENQTGLKNPGEELVRLYSEVMSQDPNFKFNLAKVDEYDKLGEVKQQLQDKKVEIDELLKAEKEKAGAERIIKEQQNKISSYEEKRQLHKQDLAEKQKLRLESLAEQRNAKQEAVDKMFKIIELERGKKTPLSEEEKSILHKDSVLLLDNGNKELEKLKSYIQINQGTLSPAKINYIYKKMSDAFVNKKLTTSDFVDSIITGQFSNLEENEIPKFLRDRLKIREGKTDKEKIDEEKKAGEKDTSDLEGELKTGRVKINIKNQNPKTEDNKVKLGNGGGKDNANPNNPEDQNNQLNNGGADNAEANQNNEPLKDYRDHISLSVSDIKCIMDGGKVYSRVNKPKSFHPNFLYEVNILDEIDNIFDRIKAAANTFKSGKEEEHLSYNPELSLGKNQFLSKTYGFKIKGSDEEVYIESVYKKSEKKEGLGKKLLGLVGGGIINTLSLPKKGLETWQATFGSSRYYERVESIKKNYGYNTYGIVSNLDKLKSNNENSGKKDKNSDTLANFIDTINANNLGGFLKFREYDNNYIEIDGQAYFHNRKFSKGELKQIFDKRFADIFKKEPLITRLFKKDNTLYGTNNGEVIKTIEDLVKNYPSFKDFKVVEDYFKLIKLSEKNGFVTAGDIIIMLNTMPGVEGGEGNLYKTAKEDSSKENLSNNQEAVAVWETQKDPKAFKVKDVEFKSFNLSKPTNQNNQNNQKLNFSRGGFSSSNAMDSSTN